jgi:TonB-dependent receptor
MFNKNYLFLLYVLSFSFVAQVATDENEIDQIEEVVSVGSRASVKSGLDKQKESNQLVSIVDSDAIGDFPDETAAEAVRRLSGVSVENDQGEGRYVTLRGMAGGLNAVSMNGALVPSPEGGRKVLLDGLPTELLDSIEVYKTLTPNQDLEGIGGRIEFKTKKATDLEETFLKFRYDTSYNEFSDTSGNPKYSLTYGDKLTDDFGVIFGYTYQSKHIISNNNELGYEPWGVAENGNKYLTRDWEMRFYDLTREREGLTIDMDYEYSPNTSFFFNYLFNEYTDDEVRHKDEYRARDVVESSVTNTSAAYQRITADKESKKRIETRQIETQIIGGETSFGDLNFRFQASNSFAEQADDNNVDGKFRSECRIREGDEICGTFNWSNPKFINIALAPAASDLLDPSTYEWDEFEIDYGLIQDEERAVKFDFENENFEMFEMPMILEFGYKFSTRNKSNTEGNLDGSRSMSPFGMISYSPYTPNNWYFPQELGFFADPDFLFGAQSQFRPLDIDLADFWETEEEINAFYLMSTFDYGNAVVVAGIRHEDTSFNTYGFNDGNINDRLDFSRDYAFTAPSINIKYFLDDNTQLRGSFYRSLSRPGFGETAPIADISENEGSLEFRGSMGNPDLEPYEANNFDVSYEYYEDNLVLTAGLFYKDIANTIYPRVVANQTVGGIFFTELETYANAGASSILGIELNLFAELDEYLPIEGFFVAMNATLSDGTSEFDTGLNTFKIPFRKLSEENANISLGYDRGKIDTRLAVNYRSSYLDYLGDEGEDLLDSDFGYGFIRFTDDYLSYDLTAKYQYSDNLSFKFEGKNLGNRPEYYYWNTSDRLSQYDEYGYTLSFGVRYSY